jgi:hypothetical protein
MCGKPKVVQNCGENGKFCDIALTALRCCPLKTENAWDKWKKALTLHHLLNKLNDFACFQFILILAYLLNYCSF